jgi:hypothetical protein
MTSTLEFYVADQKVLIERECFKSWDGILRHMLWDLFDKEDNHFLW